MLGRVAVWREPTNDKRTPPRCAATRFFAIEDGAGNEAGCRCRRTRTAPRSWRELTLSKGCRKPKAAVAPTWQDVCGLPSHGHRRVRYGDLCKGRAEVVSGAAVDCRMMCVQPWVRS